MIIYHLFAAKNVAARPATVIHGGFPSRPMHSPTGSHMSSWASHASIVISSRPGTGRGRIRGAPGSTAPGEPPVIRAAPSEQFGVSNGNNRRFGNSQKPPSSTGHGFSSFGVFGCSQNKPSADRGFSGNFGFSGGNRQGGGTGDTTKMTLQDNSTFRTDNPNSLRLCGLVTGVNARGHGLIYHSNKCRDAIFKSHDVISSVKPRMGDLVALKLEDNDGTYYARVVQFIPQSSPVQSQMIAASIPFFLGTVSDYEPTYRRGTIVSLDDNDVMFDISRLSHSLDDCVIEKLSEGPSVLFQVNYSVGNSVDADIMIVL